MPKKFQRKTKKQYPMVEVKLPDIYGDTPLVVPALASMPLKVQISGRRNDLGPMIDVFVDAKVDEETIDAITDLDGDEFEPFMKAWSDAGPVPAGKSGS